jgi:hypothetical protein
MRVHLACSLLVVVACGGSHKPAATEADTSSLESPSDPASAPASTSGSGAAGGASSSTPSPLAMPTASSASSDAAPAPAASHPVPGATGSIDGKPFSPKLAQVAGPVLKDGRRMVMLHEGSDCIQPGDAKPGDASMMLMVPWQDGYKVDLAALQRAKKGNLGEAAFVRIGGDGKKQISTTFKPTGRVTIVSAPTQKDALGKMNIDLQTGDYLVSGDLDIKVCSPGN